MPTLRSTPVGRRMEDGFSTKIAHASDPDISFWEKTVQPPGVEGGDAIELTDMHNTAWRTFAARSLLTLTPIAVTVHWDPKVYSQIIALANVEGLITVHLPNADTIEFYGFFRNFIPGPHEEGSPPEADMEVVPTCRNPTTGAEVAPVYTEASTAT